MQYMQGANPVMRKTPLVYEKFENSLKAAGINVSPDADRLNIMAMTSANVAELAGDREVRSGETLRWEDDRAPHIAGGLFDPAIFGMNGDQWGKMTPITPILNPVMEEPARILLGLKQKELQAIMAGDQPYGKYGTGFKAIGSALSDISVPLAINGYRQDIEHGKAAERDRAIRALGYLKACDATGLHPRDWMLDKVPILPPKFRPVSKMTGSEVPLIDDANYLYSQMIGTNNAARELRKYTGDTTREEFGIYDAYKQVTGLAAPTHPKLVQRQVRGLLKHVFGPGSSKWSMVQRNLLGTPTDMVGRAVVVPDPDLDMDSVGLPEEKAWEVYRPHLVHRLTKRGIPWPRLPSTLINGTLSRRKPCSPR
jgi:DNA-directed RNA polymerase, beta'' subunit/160 kD subunit